MKKIQFGALVVISIAFFAGAATAQKKTPKRPVKKPPASKPLVAPLEVRTAREKVDVQLSNVNGFVNKLGPAAQNLETADADAKAGNLKPATVAKIEVKKKEIVEAIRNIKEGLSILESSFRTKPVLQKYLNSIQGISDLAAQSEDFAIAGKFVAAKDPLRDITKKLIDTLSLLPR